MSYKSFILISFLCLSVQAYVSDYTSIYVLAPKDSLVVLTPASLMVDGSAPLSSQDYHSVFSVQRKDCWAMAKSMHKVALLTFFIKREMDQKLVKEVSLFVSFDNGAHYETAILPMPVEEINVMDKFNGIVAQKTYEPGEPDTYKPFKFERMR